MFGMAGETAFDLRFSIFKVPVRVHPIFWITSAIMFWDPDRLDHVLIGVLCMFVSVLIHELGHAVVLRHYRWPSEIVLFILGGYATSTRLSTWKQIWSLAAGPLAGISFSVLVFGVRTLLFRSSPDLFERFPVVTEAFDVLLFAGVLINLMNFVPCLPLDGGQIMAALVSHYRKRGHNTTLLILQISIASGAAVALWCAYCVQSSRAVVPYEWLRLLDLRYGLDPKFMMIFFGILTAQSVMQYNAYKA